MTALFLNVLLIKMIENTNQGKFIVFEGPDGSGQSTQVSLLRDFLIEKGHQAIITKEPTLDSEAGKKIKKVLEKEVEASPEELQELFVQDRKEHLENLIIPALKEGKFIISDRYFFSTFCFGAAAGLDMEELIKMNNDFLLPDLTFILNVRPEVCVQRITNRGSKKTLFEVKERLGKVMENYKKMPSRFENVNLVNGEQPIGKVFEDIKEVVYLEILNK